MKQQTRVKEPSIIIKPLGRFGGLDKLHLTLIVLVALLLVLLLVVSYGKPILVLPSNNTTSTGNFSTVHTQAQIKTLAERILASYAGLNSSLSLIPFISNVSSMQVSYVPQSRQWYVQLTAKNIANSVAFSIAFAINDTNTSRVTPLIQTVIPSQILNNSVVSTGVVSLGGKYTCVNPKPTQVYWFVDPYAVGSVGSLVNASEIRQMYGGSVNLTLKMFVGTDTQRIGSQVGLFDALYLSKYALCASQQSGFGSFASKLNSVYSGAYVSQNTLAMIANESGLNYTQLNSCIGTSSPLLNSQALLAQYYNITSTPVAVVDCHYLALPQTVHEALCYANPSLC
ncbi:MAG: hypothetical protein KGH57_03330 [Candidatus Micrarchaeota archaeon]|nr:hypothetical protein [Candidatus Micrarchaeota archaeon]